MNCRKILARIEAYQDGELAENEAALVAAHLNDCPACREELALLQAEDRIYESYGADVEKSLDLSPDLWKRAFEAGEKVPSQRPQVSPLPSRLARWMNFLPLHSHWVRQTVAAVFLVAVSVTGTLMTVEHFRGGDRALQGQVTGANAVEGRSLEAAVQSIQHAEQEYKNAIRVLSDIVEKQKPTLDPIMLAEFQQNLDLIDRNIAATRKAYYQHPQDADLAIYMLAAYNRKVELLQDLAS